MKRYTITLGASTTAGGKVVSATSHGSIEGKRIALEGDLVICPACKSQGKIQCIDPRIPELWNGKKVALENDLCICKCAFPPKLLPNQTLKFQMINGRGEAPPFDETSQSFLSESADTLFDEKFVLLDEDTGAPLINIEYALRRESGDFEFGITNEKGHTHLLTATAKSECIDIFL